MALKRSERKFKGRVLVVDDNWITLKLVEKMLVSFGLEVKTLDSGSAALDCLRDEDFELIFVDCMMPDVDGFSVTKEIRTREQDGPHTPVIAFTGVDSIENRRLCRAAGMDGLLAKPYSYTALEELLAKLLGQDGKKDGHAQS